LDQRTGWGEAEERTAEERRGKEARAVSSTSVRHPAVSPRKGGREYRQHLAAGQACILTRLEVKRQ
jgi:hypothetical protein